VPVLTVWMLRVHDVHAGNHDTFFNRLRSRYERLAHSFASRGWMVTTSYLVASAVIIVVDGGALGPQIFPDVGTGQFQLHLRAPAGTRIERTEKIALGTLDAIKREVGPDNVEVTLAFVGTQPPNYPINAIYLWSSGSEEALLQIQLKRNSGVKINELKEQLRTKLAEDLPD